MAWLNHATTHPLQGPGSTGPCRLVKAVALVLPEGVRTVGSDPVFGWFDALNGPLTQPVRLATTRTGAVWRAKGPDGPVVVKFTSVVERLQRELDALTRLAGLDGVCLPRVLAHGSDRQGRFAWVVYEDFGLFPVGLCRYRYDRALAALAALHAAPWSARCPGRPGGLQQYGISIVDSLPGTERSHTPDLASVAEAVWRTDWSQWRTAIRHLPATPGLERALARWVRWLSAYGQPWVERLARGFQTICHGDPHPGNLMWSARERKVCLIDWENVHKNHPYFDLFQLLDATSPAAPLVRPWSRWRALHAYRLALRRHWGRQAGAGPFVHPLGDRLRRLCEEACRLAIDEGSWVRGYACFAAFYLLWIVRRIHEDWEVGRWEEAMLSRQLGETLRALYSLGRDFAKAGGHW
ncbi:MAG: aminoglycoside phosphotransferase family protein [Alicyclobacillaceae bacterium]|nr:aminoglycoside phosphotransferase family protein [Alicyclobacillaceae bacterium]